MATPESRQRAGMIAELTKLAATQTGEERERTLAAITRVALAPTLEAAAAEARLIIPAPAPPPAEAPLPVAPAPEAPAAEKQFERIQLDREVTGYPAHPDSLLIEAFESLDTRYLTVEFGGVAQPLQAVQGIRKTMLYVTHNANGTYTVWYRPPGLPAKRGDYQISTAVWELRPQIRNDSFPLPLKLTRSWPIRVVALDHPNDVKVMQVNDYRWCIAYNDDRDPWVQWNMFNKPWIEVETADFKRWTIYVRAAAGGGEHRFYVGDSLVASGIGSGTAANQGRTFAFEYDLTVPAAAAVPVVGLPTWLSQKISGGLSWVTGWYDRLSTGVLGWLTGFRPGMLDAFKTFGANPLGPVTANKQPILTEINIELFKKSLRPEMFQTPEMQNMVRQLTDAVDPPGVVGEARFAMGLTATEVSGAAAAGDMSEFFGGLLRNPMTVLREAIEGWLAPPVPVTFEAASKARDKLIKITVDFLLLSMALDMVVCFTSATLMRNLHSHIGHVLATFDLQGIMKMMVEPMAKHAISQPLDYGYAAKFRTAVPPPAEMVRAARLELLEKDAKMPEISQATKDQLAKVGYDDFWSRVLYAASLEPPTLMDYLAKYAREGKGPPNEAELRALLLKVQAVVNMDMTRFGDVFLPRATTAPSLIAVRTGYESGAYSAEDVEAWLRWQMVHPRWWDNTRNAITGFASRSWRLRFLTAGLRQYVAGAISRDAFTAKVYQVYADPKTREWTLKAADEMKATRPARRYLPLTTYLRLYAAGLLPDSELRDLCKMFKVSDADRDRLMKLYKR